MLEIAVQVQLQQISRVRGRPARGSGCGALEAKPREVEVIDKGIKETDGILCSNVVVEPLREQDGFVAVRALDKPMKVQNSQRAKKFLVLVSSVIVYQNIAFSHSLVRS